ncbi:LLM class flavin-dependent oxidoreductase [Sesbania bispinosa]|nr:LLM class flavin-dependent oxidoreductase [Sesbania bispinosa]
MLLQEAGAINIYGHDDPIIQEGRDMENRMGLASLCISPNLGAKQGTMLVAVDGMDMIGKCGDDGLPCKTPIVCVGGPERDGDPITQEDHAMEKRMDHASRCIGPSSGVEQDHNVLAVDGLNVIGKCGDDGLQPQAFIACAGGPEWNALGPLSKANSFTCMGRNGLEVRKKPNSLNEGSVSINVIGSNKSLHTLNGLGEGPRERLKECGLESEIQKAKNVWGRRHKRWGADSS